MTNCVQYKAVRSAGTDVARSARSRMRAETPVCRSRMKTAAVQRNVQSCSQYPPSKYASERARCSAGTWSRYARVAAAGSMDPEAPLATGGGGERGIRSTGAAASTPARRSGIMAMSSIGEPLQLLRARADGPAGARLRVELDPAKRQRIEHAAERDLGEVEGGRVGQAGAGAEGAGDPRAPRDLFALVERTGEASDPPEPAPPTVPPEEG